MVNAVFLLRKPHDNRRTKARKGVTIIAQGVSPWVTREHEPKSRRDGT